MINLFFVLNIEQEQDFYPNFENPVQNCSLWFHRHLPLPGRRWRREPQKLVTQYKLNFALPNSRLICLSSGVLQETYPKKKRKRTKIGQKFHHSESIDRVIRLTLRAVSQRHRTTSGQFRFRLRGNQQKREANSLCPGQGWSCCSFLQRPVQPSSLVSAPHTNWPLLFGQTACAGPAVGNRQTVQ